MTYLIIQIIKAFCLGWLLAYFEPVQYVIQKMSDRITNKNFILQYIRQGLHCHKCMAFWSCLIMTNFNVFAAAATAIMVYVYDVIITRLRG